MYQKYYTTHIASDTRRWQPIEDATYVHLARGRIRSSSDFLVYIASHQAFLSLRIMSQHRKHNGAIRRRLDGIQRTALRPYHFGRNEQSYCGAKTSTYDFSWAAAYIGIAGILPRSTCWWQNVILTSLYNGGKEAARVFSTDQGALSSSALPLQGLDITRHPASAAPAPANCRSSPSNQ